MWPKILLGLVPILLLSTNFQVHCQQQSQWDQLAELRHYSGPRTSSHVDKSSESSAEIADTHLESMEDLEHVAYLSMRNFNLTDESLLQSSLLVGLGNSIVHKQHQKIDPLASSDPQGRLELMLESFIWHLRNGHLKRLSLDELMAIGESLETNSLNLTTTTTNEPGLEKKRQATRNSTGNHKVDTNSQPSESSARCQHLVNIYLHELRERQRRSIMDQQPPPPINQQVPESRIEYELAVAAAAPRSSIGTASDSPPSSPDSARLMQLCHLAVKCHSTDELVELISGSWKQPAPKVAPAMLEPMLEPATTPRARREADAEYARATGGQRLERARYPKSLRESLSTSLAKLCPLILFQLHDDDGLCTMRRDDRPPMITVWGFATLFVTIVSFCSLIGLSITPLLGPTATHSSGMSEISGADQDELAGYGRGTVRPPSAASFNQQQQQQQQLQYQHEHRACLTLFEGLAVGSLVGSALFSLIPQAFELQERESNQGFLLKALIIFFGIYLFFLSERIMRIILDTRQQRKKKKRLQHRSSNSMALPSTTADFDQHLLPPFAAHGLLQSSCLSTSSATAASSARQAASAVRLTRANDGSQQPMSSSSGGRRVLANPVSFIRGGNLSGHSGQDRVNSLNLREDRLRQQQQQHQLRLRQTTVDQHNEMNRQQQQTGGDALRSVNFEKMKTKRMSPAKDGRKKVASESARASLESAQSPSIGVNLATKSIGRRRSPLDAAAAAAVASAGDGAGKRRKTRQQLQAAKRRRNKRLVQKHQMAPRHGGKAAGAGKRDELAGFQDTMASSFLSQAAKSLPTSCSSPAPYEGCVCGLATAPQVAATDTTAYLHHFYLNSSSSSCCSSYDSNDDLYNSQLGLDDPNNANGNDDDDDDGYFIAAKSSYRSQGLPAVDRERLASLHPLAMTKQERQWAQQESQRNSLKFNANHLPLEPPAMAATKQDISTVAWMIVLGDGLHNFIDGISIGAAFSESILSGVSISVAVICEEFPHELGDFAVLVSSGMTVRQALGYNFLSACTCYFGMAIGIILGDVNDGASYISALAAGVFLYIALVDMMGELSATLEETSRDSIAKTLKLLLLQNVGIFIGISIIFILSFIDF